MLAAGADAQVGQRLVAGHQATLEQLGGDIVRRQVPALDLPRQALCGLDDVPLAAVVGGDLEEETGIAGSGGFRFAHGRLQLRMETRAIADDAQADAVLVELAHLAAQGHETAPSAR